MTVQKGASWFLGTTGNTCVTPRHMYDIFLKSIGPSVFLFCIILWLHKIAKLHGYHRNATGNINSTLFSTTNSIMHPVNVSNLHQYVLYQANVLLYFLSKNNLKCSFVVTIEILRCGFVAMVI